MTHPAQTRISKAALDRLWTSAPFGGTTADFLHRQLLTRWLANHPRVEGRMSRTPTGPMRTYRFDPECLRVRVLPHRHGGTTFRLDGFNILAEPEVHGWDPVFMHTEHGLSEYDRETGYAIDRLIAHHKIRVNDKRVLPDGHRYVDALALAVLVNYLADRDRRDALAAAGAP